MMEANRHVSVIKRKMQRALLSTNISRWEGDKTRGKLNPRSLFRVPIGTSKRVFRQKVEAEDFDTAVLIMIDHSGSMAGHKLDLAAKTAIVLGEVLNQLNIPFSVRGFSTGDSYVAHERFRHAKPAEQQTYKRWGNLWIGVYKEFDELWGQHQHKLINMVRNDRANTYDGESLRYGAQLLLHRPEKRKIMFWLNDGAPCPNSGDDIAAHEEYARDCAKEVEKMVETVAIGICTDAVKRFYTNCAVVYKVDELPTVCLTTLDELLRKGKTLIQQTSGTRIAKAFQ
jgi:cobaltochelatase CobT